MLNSLKTDFRHLKAFYSLFIPDDRFSQSQNLERTRYSTVSGKKYQQLELMNSRGYRRDSNNTNNSPYVKRFRNNSGHAHHNSVESSLSCDPVRDEAMYVYEADLIKS